MWQKLAAFSVMIFGSECLVITKMFNITGDGCQTLTVSNLIANEIDSSNNGCAWEKLFSSDFQCKK